MADLVSAIVRAAFNDGESAVGGAEEAREEWGRRYGGLGRRSIWGF